MEAIVWNYEGDLYRFCLPDSAPLDQKGSKLILEKATKIPDRELHDKFVKIAEILDSNVKVVRRPSVHGSLRGRAETLKSTFSGLDWRKIEMLMTDFEARAKVHAAQMDLDLGDKTLTFTLGS